MHARDCVRVDALAAACVQQRAGLVQTKAQIRDVERHELAVSKQIRCGERQPPSRAEDQVNVRRKIEREIGEEFGGRCLRHRMHIVEHERSRTCGFGQFAEQPGDRFEGVHAAAKRLLDHAGWSGPPERRVRAEQQCLNETSAIVVAVEREPCGTSTRGEPLAAHSCEQ